MNLSEVPYKSGDELDELARLLIIRSCGNLQNLMQQDGYENLVDTGGLAKVGIDKYDVQDFSEKAIVRYDYVENCLILSYPALNLLPNPSENLKFAIADAIAKAVFLRPYYLAGLQENEVTSMSIRKAGRGGCDPAWQRWRFAFGWVLPRPLMLKSQRDGMSISSMSRRFRVAPETVAQRLEML